MYQYACVYTFTNMQEHAASSRTRTRESQEEPTLDDSEQVPSVLPEGQYHVEKLLAQRKRVQIAYS